MTESAPFAAGRPRRRVPTVGATVGAAVAALVLALSPSASAAQLEEFRGGETWVGTSRWLGGLADDLRTGWRSGLALWGTPAPLWSAGVEGSYGRSRARNGNGTVAEALVGVVVRRALGEIGSRTTPFAQGRLGYHRLSGVSARQDGLLVGPEVGAEIALAHRLFLVAALDASWQWYRDSRDDGEVFEDTGGYGFRWGVRIGLLLREDPRRTAGGG